MTTFVDFSGRHWIDEHGGWLWCAPRAMRRPAARQIPGGEGYEGCRFCGGGGHRADECEARWRASMAKLIGSMERRKGIFWVQNEAKKLLQPQGCAAKKTPKTKQRDGEKGEGKNEAKKVSEEQKKKKKKKAQETKAREEAKTAREGARTEGKKKKKEKSEEEGKEGEGKGEKGEGEGESKGEGEREEAEKSELQLLESAGSETDGDGWAACLPQNAEEEPASRAEGAKAVTAAAAQETAAEAAAAQQTTAAQLAAEKKRWDEVDKQEHRISKIAAEQKISLEDATEVWFDEIERFAVRRSLRFDDAISVWLKEKEVIDDGKE